MRNSADSGSLSSKVVNSNSYTVFNKPYLMSQAGNSVSIDYGPNRERYRRIEVKGGNTTTTHYVASFEKIWRPNGINETKRYLDGEVIVTTRSNGTRTPNTCSPITWARSMCSPTTPAASCNR